MKVKLFKSALSTVAVSIALAGSAFADVVTFDIQASGSSFGVLEGKSVTIARVIPSLCGSVGTPPQFF